MKYRYIPLLSSIMIFSLLCGCAPNVAQESEQQEAVSSIATVVQLIADIETTQYFTDDPVAEADIETILMAGVNAPSGMNGQPWHFTAVTDDEVLQEIAGGMSFGGAPSDGMGALPEGIEPLNGDEERAEPAVTPDASDPVSAKDEAPSNSGEHPDELKEAPDDPIPFGGDNKPEKKDSQEQPTMAGGVADSDDDSDENTIPSMTGNMSKAGLTDAPLAIVISCEEGSELDAGLACQNMSVVAQMLGYGTKIISSPTVALNGEKQTEFSELLGIPDGQKSIAVLLVGVKDTSVDTTADAYTGATERNPMDEMVTHVNPW